MSATSRTPWRPARLHRRLTLDQRWTRREKRQQRGGGSVLGSFDGLFHHIGRNHRQGPPVTDDLAPPIPMALPPKGTRRHARNRPAARPSWAIRAGLRRRGSGYGRRGT